MPTVVLVLTACGSGSSMGSAGQLLTVPCDEPEAASGCGGGCTMQMHAVQQFPGETWEEIEATVYYVTPSGAELLPFTGGTADTAADKVTDGQVDVLCPTAGPNETKQVSTIQLYVRP